MKVAYITEMTFLNKPFEEGSSTPIPRNYEGMKTEIAWPCALKADCYSFNFKPNKKYDLGIIIIPKLNSNNKGLLNTPFLEIAKSYCNQVAIMQEGPHWYFQGYSLEDQVLYYNSLQKADFIYVHNESDKKYFSGITGKEDVRILPTLMIEDQVKNLPEVERTGTMIGGNFVEWYGGFDSFMVASSIQHSIYSPKMGRRQEGEEQMGINQLPYMPWTEFIKELNKRKYGVHLMKTFAAGTFALNCAYLGIPCIGYKGLDTQEKCHPNLSVDLGDIVEAKRLIRILDTDSEFYEECSKNAKLNYKKYYHENIFNTTIQKQFKIS